MSLRILGIGTAVPDQSIAQVDAARLSTRFCHDGADRARLLRGLYRRTGVDRRHSVLLQPDRGDGRPRQEFYPPCRGPADRGPTTRQRMEVYEEHAPLLAVTAARRAVEDSAVDPSAFSHVITVSCTGFQAPGIDAALIESLGLRPSVERTHVGFMGCHGALNGLRVASSFVQARPGSRVLVCSVELCSLHYFYGWDPDKIVANALFADGAGAVVGVAGDDGAVGPEGVGTDPWKAVADGTLLMPDCRDAMSWHIGDHGFHMTLSPRVPELIRQRVPGWLEEWLGGSGVGLDDVGTWAVHPGGPRILSAFAEGLSLDDDAMAVSREVLAEHGNMSSATILFILERLRQRDAPRPCVALGFGPGLVVEALLLR